MPQDSQEKCQLSKIRGITNCNKGRSSKFYICASSDQWHIHIHYFGHGLCVCPDEEGGWEHHFPQYKSKRPCSGVGWTDAAALCCVVPPTSQPIGTLLLALPIFLANYSAPLETTNIPPPNKLEPRRQAQPGIHGYNVTKVVPAVTGVWASHRVCINTPGCQTPKFLWLNRANCHREVNWKTILPPRAGAII